MSQESPESVFDKQAINSRVEAAVEALYGQYGTSIPDAIEQIGEDARNTTHDLLGRKSVTSKATFIATLDDMKGRENINDDAYDLIMENLD